MLSPAKTYFPALTGLRALAAFAVFGFHHRDAPVRLPWLQVMLGELHVGVSIFFTLSGFLIACRYAGRRFDGALWRRYLLHRVARIWPVYLALALVTLAASYPTEGRAHPGQWLTEALLSLTLLKGFSERWYLSGITQAWSLTVEECFYLLAPLLLALGARYRPARAWPLLAVAVAALGLGLYASLPALGSPLFVLRATIFGRLTEFLVGAAFAWALRQRPPAAGPEAGGRATWGGLTGVALGLAVLVAVQRLSGNVSITTGPGVLANNLLLPLGTGWLLSGLCRERTWLSAALATRPLQALGRASYCFYLLHMGILPTTLRPLLMSYLPGGAGLLALFGALVLASLALHRWLEQPAYRWLTGRGAA